MRAVLDTNVLVSALFWRGASYLVVRQAFRGAFEVATSADLLREYDRVLAEDFRLPEKDRLGAIREVRSFAVLVEPSAPPAGVTVRDPDDRRVLACALGGEADFIVTGDRDLLVLGEVAGVRIVTPRAFLGMVGE